MDFKHPLTKGQLEGYDLFARFFMDPMENVMCLKGWSGTGKSTLVQYILMMIPKLNDMIKLLDPEYKPMDICLTATTNPAAEALYTSIDMLMETSTVHSKLGLIPLTDYRTGKKTLSIKRGAEKLVNTVLFIDEASYIDQLMLSLIFKQVENCKLVFIGDHGQLTPITSTYMPAFEMNRNEIELTEPVRQAPGTPLSKLIMDLRDTVFTGNWHKFELDNETLRRVDQPTFEHMAQQAFTNPDKVGTSKILTYSNNGVNHYNNLMTQQIDGQSDVYEGQRMVANEFANLGASSIKNGEEVLVEHVEISTDFDVEGYHLQLRNKAGTYFMPKRAGDKKSRLSKARAAEEWDVVKIITDEWVDLRPTYACTVNKAQGSTFNTGFIDLNDICAKARTGNQLARLLYVGISRFRDRVIFTGDMQIKG